MYDGARWASVCSHHRPWRALYHACAPERSMLALKVQVVVGDHSVAAGGEKLGL